MSFNDANQTPSPGPYDVPQSTDNTIIFLYDFDDEKYVLNQSAGVMNGNTESQEEIESFLKRDKKVGKYKVSLFLIISLLYGISPHLLVKLIGGSFLKWPLFGCVWFNT